MEYLSDIAMRIALRMDELEGASTVEKAEAICDLFEGAGHQEPVNEPVVTNPMIFAAMSRADELGIPMSDWQANSILTASLQKQESGEK